MRRRTSWQALPGPGRVDRSCLQKLLAAERDSQVWLHEGRDEPGPDHRAVTAERGSLAVGYVEGLGEACVAAAADAQRVMSRANRGLDCFLVLNPANALAVDSDVDPSPPQLYAKAFSYQPERRRHHGLPFRTSATSATTAGVADLAVVPVR